MAGIIDKLPSNYNILSPVAFKFEIAKLPSLTFWCQTANIPDLSLGSITVPNPLRDYPLHGNQLELGTFDMDFVVDEDLINYLEIYEWMRSLGSSDTTDDYKSLSSDPNPNRGIVSDGILMLLTNTMNTNKEVHFIDMFPTSLGTINFTSSSDAIEAITCDVSFTYSDFLIKSSI